MSRYLYYAFLLIPMLLHKFEWLVGGTLGASMLFSSIATVHGVALAAVRGRGTLDLDIIPVFAITGVGMLAGTPMMIWSKTLRAAATSARALVFCWIGVMWVGIMASVASMKAVPKPQPCEPTSLLEGSCGLQCNATLPMRSGQTVISVPYLWKNLLFDYSGHFAAFGSGFAMLALMYASGRQSPREMALQQLNEKGMPKRIREKNAGKAYFYAFIGPPVCLGLALAQIVITERIMLGSHHVPLGEGIDAVGQWGVLVGAFFAVIASVMKVWIHKRKVPAPETQREWPVSNNQDIEANNLGAMVQSTSGSPRRYDFGSYDFGLVFREGAWWGHGLDGSRIPHDGVEWIVRDGKLQRNDDVIR